MITAPYIIQKFGVEDFGRLQIMMQWTLSFALLDFGIAPAILNNTSVRVNIKDMIFKNLSYFMQLLLFFLFIFSLLLLALYDNWILLCITLAVTHIYSNFVFSFASTKGMLASYQKIYNYLIFLSIIFTVLLIDYLNHYQLVYFLWIAPFILAFFIVKSKIGCREQKKINFQRLKVIYIVADGHKFFILTVISIVSFSLDNFIIAYCLDYESVTEFVLHSKTVTPFLMLFAAGHMIFWGQLSSIKQSRSAAEYNHLVKWYIYRLIAIYLLFLYLLFLFNEALLIFISNGEVSYDSFLITNIIVFSTLNVLGGVLVVLVSLERIIDVQITLGLKAMFVNVLLSIFLVNNIGTSGPILASNVSLFYFYTKLYQIYKKIGST